MSYELLEGSCTRLDGNSSRVQLGDPRGDDPNGVAAVFRQPNSREIGT